MFVKRKKARYFLTKQSQQVSQMNVKSPLTHTNMALYVCRKNLATYEDAYIHWPHTSIWKEKKNNFNYLVLSKRKQKRSKSSV